MPSAVVGNDTLPTTGSRTITFPVTLDAAPTVVLAWMTSETAEGVQQIGRISYGVSDGSSDYNHGIVIKNASGSSVTRKQTYDNRSIIEHSTASVTGVYWTMDTFTTTGFQVVTAGGTAAGAFQFHYLAISAANVHIVQQAALTSSLPATDTIAGSLGWTPTLAFMLGGIGTSTGNSTNARLGFGVYDGTTQGCVSGRSRHGRSVIDDAMLHSTTRGMVAVNASNFQTRMDMTCDSLDASPSGGMGVTYNATSGSAQANLITFVLIDGNAADVQNNVTIPTSGNVDVDFAFDPDFAMFIHGRVLASAPDTISNRDLQFGIGAVDSGDRDAAAVMMDDEGASTSLSVTDLSNSSALETIDDGATANQAVASGSMITDGVRLTYSAQETTANKASIAIGWQKDAPELGHAGSLVNGPIIKSKFEGLVA